MHVNKQNRYLAGLMAGESRAPTCDVGVFLLSPLRNKDCDFPVPSAPKGLYSYGNPTTRKDPMESMPGESK